MCITAPVDAPVDARVMCITAASGLRVFPVGVVPRMPAPDASLPAAPEDEARRNAPDRQDVKMEAQTTKRGSSWIREPMQADSDRRRHAADELERRIVVDATGDAGVPRRAAHPAPQVGARASTTPATQCPAKATAGAQRGRMLFLRKANTLCRQTHCRTWRRLRLSKLGKRTDRRRGRERRAVDAHAVAAANIPGSNSAS